MTDSVIVKFAGIAKEFVVSKTIDLGFTTVRWYGAIIAFGFLLAVLFGGRIAYKWKINLDKMIDILLYGTIFGIIGARLYFVVCEWDYYGSHLSEIFKIWEGGLAIYGGLIAGIAAAFIVCKIEKINFCNLLDMAAMSFLIGQGIGRWGNFANQEAFGTITYKNWGMMSDTVVSYIENHAATFGLENIDNIPEYIAENNLFVHPTFFYESIWCLLGFGILYLILRKYRKFSGQLFLTYGVWYGFERMIVEGMRTDSLYIANTGIRVSQLISAILMFVCLLLLVIFMIKYTKHPKPIEGIDYFPPKSEKELKAEKLKLEKKELKAKQKGYKIVNGKMVKISSSKNISDELISAEDEALTSQQADEAVTQGESVEKDNDEENEKN